MVGGLHTDGARYPLSPSYVFGIASLAFQCICEGVLDVRDVFPVDQGTREFYIVVVFKIVFFKVTLLFL